VLVEVADPQSRNTKIRPAVIVSETDEIADDGAIFCVAVNSTLPQKVPDDYVLLPFHRGGRARTGLKH
jgi:mRNA-degrading endonuclease toxin of MazEF toxin-antitoxin module